MVIKHINNRGQFFFFFSNFVIDFCTLIFYGYIDNTYTLQCVLNYF